MTCPANAEALTHFSWSITSRFLAGRLRIAHPLQILLKKTALMFVIGLSQAVCVEEFLAFSWCKKLSAAFPWSFLFPLGMFFIPSDEKASNIQLYNFCWFWKGKVRPCSRKEKGHASCGTRYSPRWETDEGSCGGRSERGLAAHRDWVPRSSVPSMAAGRRGCDGHYRKGGQMTWSTTCWELFVVRGALLFRSRLCSEEQTSIGSSFLLFSPSFC